ncbi:hypothetical protein GCM10009127_06790 [Alteraurantiacibacter aestuarii]|uniref:TIGR02281 family clan AA aspartic protease n=1 Tax=Alteraurantiacibacter aestuarii TaxID=650004 RepID=A0A844ZQ34_9SPHN|nr:TIGR02281 family clan AA aspartic protease [Alteraurantiacibacter aestuarii]MXO89156.1 TIGR02281 family clan AA aspartic protease [Alteraurantiacibacter aestuarii]
MDIKLPLAAMLMAGGVLGLAMPLISNGNPQEAGKDLANLVTGGEFTPEPQLGMAQQTATGWAENTVLERQADGHFYADVRVDDRSYRMLVDTGATVVALTGTDAADMGLQWYEDDVAPVAQGASGPIEGVNVIIDRMSLGGHEATGVRAIIIPEGASTSLLGQSFLSTVRSVEISGDRMVLGN